MRAPAGILDLWRADLVARVGAGTTVAELDGALEDLGLDSGLVVPRPERATLGGIFASGEANLVGGANRGLRELALGALLFDGVGRPLDCGARVVKNVAGYDTLRIHHGAGGAFGAIGDLVLRLRAIPEERGVTAVGVHWDELAEVLPGWRREVGADTVGELLLDAEASRRLGWADQPLLCRVAEGSSAVVRRWAAEVGGEEIGPDFGRIRDLGFEEDTRATVVLRVVTRTSRLLESWPSLHAELEREGRSLALIHDGRTQVARVVGFGPFERETVGRLAQRVAADLGPVTVDRGPLPAPDTNSGPTERWVQRLRRSLDPAGIFPPVRRRFGGAS